MQRDADRDVLLISKPVIGRISNKPTINFTRQIINQSGEFIGVVAASVDPGYLRASIRGSILARALYRWWALMACCVPQRRARCAHWGFAGERAGFRRAAAPGKGIVHKQKCNRRNRAVLQLPQGRRISAADHHRPRNQRDVPNFRKNAAVLIATLLGVTLITFCLMWFWNKTDTRLDHKRFLLRAREQRVRGEFQQLERTLANIPTKAS